MTMQCAPGAVLPSRPVTLRLRRVQSARRQRITTKAAVADAKLDERVRRPLSVLVLRVMHACLTYTKPRRLLPISCLRCTNGQIHEIMMLFSCTLQHIIAPRRRLTDVHWCDVCRCPSGEVSSMPWLPLTASASSCLEACACSLVYHRGSCAWSCACHLIVQALQVWGGGSGFTRTGGLQEASRVAADGTLLF